MALTRVSGGILKQPIDVGIITATSLNASGIITAGTVQVGSATTIHTTGIDLGSGNVTSHNINSTGIITATSLVGPVTGNVTGNLTGDVTGNVTGDVTGNVTGNITATTGSFSGDVSVGGTLTYEDVTNIDSVGIITAQAGIHVTGGSVGIGLTNPEKNLVVSSNSSPTIRINNSDGSISADQTIGVIEFKANDGSGDGSQVTGSIESISQAAFTGQGSPSHLIFKTNGVSGADALTERLRVDSSGRLGLGTTDPGSYFSDATELVVADTDHDCGITIASSSSHKGTIAFADGTSGDAAYRGYINYIHSSDSLQLATSGTERLRIISDGKIGIGITNPSAKLDIYRSGSGAAARFGKETIFGELQVDGQRIGIQGKRSSDNAVSGFFVENPTSTGTSNFELVTIKTAGTERLRINSSGQVSIGNNPTVASDAALHIELDGTREYLRLEGDGGGSNAYFEIEAPNNRRKAIIFKSGGTRRGVIGVGDSDEASATSLFLSASTNIAGNNPHMVINSAGLIGIGNDNPTVALDVKRATAGLIGKFYDTGSNGGALYNGGPILGLSRISNGSVSLNGLLFQVGIDKNSSTSYNIDETVFSVTNIGVGIGIDNPSPTYLLEADGPIRSGSSGSSLPKGAGFRQHAVCSAGLSNRLVYNVFDGYYAEKSFSHYFPNSQSNRALRIHSNRSSWWTCGFITIHSTYSNQNASGMLRYSFAHNANGTSAYGKFILQDVSLGSTSANFGMNTSYSFKTWGSNGGSADSHALEIRHLTSTGNGCYVTVELYGSTASTYIDDLYMTTGHTY